MIENKKVPKKRGRKPKPKSNKPKGPPKKRGRKPKGGKIIKKEDIVKKIENEKMPSIVLHLKCSTDKIENNDINYSLPMNIKYDSEVEKLKNFQMGENGIFKSSFKQLDNYKESNNENNILFSNNQENQNTSLTDNKGSSENVNIKKVYTKLNELKENLKLNNISDKKSSCFWCTCDFDNPAIFIPKQFNDGNIDVYGCFCSPECAVAYLNNENIDDASRWERYSLLNNIYCKIYDYKKNIKPAPSPFYTLDKYYGNLSIQEYRKLINNERIIMVIDKPMTKILPEIFEDNNEMPNVNNNLLNNNKKGQSRMLVSKQPKSKKEIMQNNFS
tara:strand:- start:1419 stop:2408 length:990 start_codon:yes stop_codon:yes gene_type:complete